MFSLSLLLSNVRRIVRVRTRRALSAKRTPNRRAPRPRPLDANAPFAFSPRFGRAMVMLSFSLAAPFIVPGVSAAAGVLPSGFQSTDGHATMTRTPNAVDVTVTAPVAVINWNGGTSVAQGYSWNFTNASGANHALAVNIDKSGAMANIDGAINGYGPGMSALFVNPYGYRVGSNATVNMSGYAAFVSGTVQIKPSANAQEPNVELLLNNGPATVAPGAQMHGGGALPIGQGQQISAIATGPAATIPSMAAGTIDAQFSGSNTNYQLTNGAISADKVRVQTDGSMGIANSTINAGSELALSGQQSLTISNSQLTAADAGATAELGGGHRGQDASLVNASTTTIDQGTTITTGARSNVAVWSQDYTSFNGSIVNPSGDAEVSSAGTLNYGPYALANLAGPYGYGWLTLDPNMVNITPGGTGSASGGYTTGGYVTADPATISNNLLYSNVLIQATTAIQEDGTITGGVGTSLAFASGGSISITSNGHINLNGGSLTITYNDQNAPAGAVGSNGFGFYGPGFVMAPGASVTTNGGSVTAAPGSYGGRTAGAVDISSGATIDTTTANGTGGNISLGGVGLTAAQGANAITGAGVSIGGGVGGKATLSAGTGNITLIGTGSTANGGNGVALNAGTVAGGDSSTLSTTTGAITVQGTAGTNATGEDGVLIGGNGTSPTIQSGSGAISITGSSTTQVGVSFEGGGVASNTGNVSVTGTGAAAATGGATNAQLTSANETVEGIYANQGATISTAGNVSMTADSAALFGATIDANTITGTIAGGLNLSTNGGAAPQTATTSIAWTAGALESNGSTFTAPITTLTATSGDLLVNGSQFVGDATTAAAGELTFGLTTTTGSLGNSIGGSADPTTVSGSLTASGNSVNVEENLSGQNLTLVSQNSLTIGTAAQAAANLPGPSVQAGDLLALTTDAKNTNTSNFDPTSVLVNYGTATSMTGNVKLQLSAPTGDGTQAITVPAVTESNPAAINDPNVPHPGYTWVPNTPPAAQTGTVTYAANVLGDLSPYETAAMKTPGSDAFYTEATGRTVYNESASVVPKAQTYIAGTWVEDQTTPPSNGGGGTTTPPTGGGGTTTPPSNPGGGDTTPPSNPGNPTTPPVTPPTTPTTPTQPPVAPPTVPAVDLPDVVPPTTILADPTVTTPTLRGNTLFIPSANTAMSAGATLSLPQVSAPSEASPSNLDESK